MKFTCRQIQPTHAPRRIHVCSWSGNEAEKQTEREFSGTEWTVSPQTRGSAVTLFFHIFSWLIWHVKLVRITRAWHKSKLGPIHETKTKYGLVRRGRPPDPLTFFWPGRKFVPLISSVRTRLNLWLTHLSINFAKFSQMTSCKSVSNMTLETFFFWGTPLWNVTMLMQIWIRLPETNPYATSTKKEFVNRNLTESFCQFHNHAQ